MTQAPTDEAKFHDIFHAPTIDRMLHEIGDTGLEHFVAYVFRHAGFAGEYTGTNMAPVWTSRYSWAVRSRLACKSNTM
jgi:hypothetical protein